MIDFDDVSIFNQLTQEDGGPVDFYSDTGLVKGYSLFIMPEGDGDIFEILLSEKELKAMLKEIQEKL